MSKYIIFLIQALGILLSGFECMGSGSEVGFIAPTAEQNYNNLMEIAKGAKSVKVLEIHKNEVLSPVKEPNIKNYQNVVHGISEEKGAKIISPEIIEKQETNELKEKESEKLKEKKPDELKEKKSEKDILIKPEGSIPEKKEGKFLFKPFAEVARAVGIPAHSSYKEKSELHISFNGVLDSTTLLELYYFDYDRFVISRPILDGKEDAWISKSLLSLLYKSEQEEPLSFLMLSYGITSTHWQNFIPEEDLDAPETVVEEAIQEHDPSRGDIIFDK
ncbi:Uncharacterized protein cpbgf_6001170 [Cryptosporidium parvum]|uniref:Lipoprotein n=1 Tax=Cryptosporidium parvum TaxID=5807 RepID=A0A7S7LEE1_CRYPV|nr:Uncharacterized protein CPATCC_0012650 [Cryptosporidium parvum]WRK32714.1 Uncharacterized protein cpbgf_6001170 [Cryptosporidium parvum]|eukprot:QOY40995.1 hypothetical protein CPATCC_002631 [Cryptosporidium parvum]